MRTTQRIAKNSSVYLLAQVISCILSFFFFMYTARYLGAKSFGILSFALALTAIFGVFGDLGLRQIATREVARNKSLAKKYLGNIVGIKIILVTIVLGILVLVINLLGCPEKTKAVVYLISLSIIFNAFLQAFYGIFQAHERMEFESAGNILRSSLLLVCVLFVIRNNSSILILAFSYSLVSAVTLGYAFIISLWKFEKPKIEIDWSFCKPTLKEALPFGLTAVFGMIYHWIDTVMLSMMKGDIAVSWYNAAYRTFFVILFIPSAFNVAIFPVMSRFYISSKDSLKFICEKYLKYMIILGIPIGIGTTLIADKIILLIFGNEYASSIIALQILIWSATLIFISSSYARLFESINKQIIITKIMGVAVLFNILLNLIVIPRYSYIGASITTVVSELLVTIAVIVMATKTIYKIQNSVIINLLLRVSISSLLMGLFIVWFKDINLFFLIALSSMIYFGIFYLIKGFNQEDLALAKKIINYSKQ